MRTKSALRQFEILLNKAINDLLDKEECSGLFSDIAYVHGDLAEHMTKAALIPLEVMAANQEWLKNEGIDLTT